MAHVITTKRGDIKIYWSHSTRGQRNKETICTIYPTYAGTTKFFRGEARCHRKDTYRKWMGRILSLNRALIAAGFDHAERSAIFMELRKRGVNLGAPRRGDEKRTADTASGKSSTDISEEPLQKQT